MEKAKVYFSDLRALPGTSLPEKLKKLIRRAGIGEIDFEKKMTAIKIHFGEPGNLSYLRPNWAKAVADVVKRARRTSVSDGLQHPVCGTPERCAGAHRECL